MSSLEIAELTGKEHKHVMADIRKMLTGLGKRSADFSAVHRNTQNKEQPHFILDHDHVMCLVTGYKVQLRMAVIRRLRALESGEATPWHEQQDAAKAEQPELPDFSNPAEAARAWAEQYERAGIGRSDAEN
ncbi:Rha family transcriptional regulator [Salinisphaera orenii]|uniref:Phage antirepressor n=1 Tax=Salinisphaera orenii YIM 95161 TaxID=1051139 RepID=A0A423PM92_9GAMM|nr:Rha family transcriptional regulator [Salinisphaera halophila]ROO26726.1 phage antirepressor [Salinisphaera halophila YIM 95161]